MESITLYFKQGSSDKVYQASIVPKGNGHIVEFAYGRRGSTMATGTKTPAPVEYSAAKAIYDKRIKEKTAKGYRAGESATAYQSSPTAKNHTGIYCQLLNPVEEDQLDRLIADPGYWAQEKHDGRRLLIQKQSDAITGINKLGFPIAVPQVIERSARALPRDFLMDGELVGDTFHVFDLLEIDGRDLRPDGYSERMLHLINLLAATFQKHILMIQSAFLPLQKVQLLEELQSGGKEGIVFKRLDAPYTVGRPASGGPQLKLKFCASASCLVGKINAKRSVRLELLDGDQLVSVGNVTIPTNFEVPPLGAVVECRYLYAFKGGSLFQPVYLGRRDDVSPQECNVGQLKFKPEPEREAA